MKTVENTTMNENYKEDNNYENNTEETSHNEKSHKGKNQQQIDDIHFHPTYSVEDKFKKMKKFPMQKKKGKDQRFFTPKKATQFMMRKMVGNENTDPTKRKISNTTMFKMTKIRRFTALKRQHIERTDDKTKKSKVEKIFHKRNKKFVAVTPNSGYHRDENKKVMSIQTDVSFKINKKDKVKKIIITKENQQDQTPRSTPSVCDGPFRNKSTQTAATEMKMAKKEDQKETGKYQQKSLTKKNNIRTRGNKKSPKEMYVKSLKSKSNQHRKFLPT